MVVVSTVPSTSSPATSHKKNRRKLHKKRTAAGNDDADMQETEDAQNRPAATAEGGSAIAAPNGGDDDELMIDADDTTLPTAASAPVFPELPASAQRTTLKSETRSVPIPPHRMTPLKKEWVNIFGPLTEMLGLQVRMNVPRRSVEIRVRTVT